MEYFNKNNCFNICNLYLGLWSLYYIQGTIYPMGSIIPRACLILSLLITLIYWGRSILSYQLLPQPLKVMNILVFVLFIYAIIYQLMGDFAIREFDGEIYSGIDNLRAIMGSLLPIFPIFFFTINGYLNPKSIRIWTAIYIFVITCQFIAYETVRSELSIYDTDGLTNNIAYYFVALLPAILLFTRNKLMMYVFLFYIMCFLIYGMKRGAIFIGIISIVYIIYRDFKTSSIKKKILIILLFGSIIVIMAYYIFYLASSNNYFQYRLEQTLAGESSGRDSYYILFWNSFINESSAIKFLFGGGTYYTVRINGNLAHNDWLEILLNQGILGISIFIAYWFSWLKYIKEFKFTEYFPVLISFWGIFIMKTLFSMSITDTLVYGMLPIGYCLGRIHLNEHL